MLHAKMPSFIFAAQAFGSGQMFILSGFVQLLLAAAQWCQGYHRAVQDGSTTTNVKLNS